MEDSVAKLPKLGGLMQDCLPEIITEFLFLVGGTRDPAISEQFKKGQRIQFHSDPIEVSLFYRTHDRHRDRIWKFKMTASQKWMVSQKISPKFILKVLYDLNLFGLRGEVLPLFYNAPNAFLSWRSRMAASEHPCYQACALEKNLLYRCAQMGAAA